MNKILLFTLLISIQSFGQIKDRDYYIKMTKALGYVYGVENLNNEIIQKYPSLKIRTMQSNNDFILAHGKAISLLENELLDELKLDKRDFKTKIQDEAKKINIENKFSYDDALLYLDNFKNERIYGNNKNLEDFVKTLLGKNPLYNANPAKEILDNFNVELSTDGMSKAKGVNLLIEVPKSWNVGEGRHPNVVYTMSSYNKKCLLALNIKDFFKYIEEESGLSKDDFNDYINSKEFKKDIIDLLFSEDFIKEMVAGSGITNVKKTDSKKYKIDGNDALKVKILGDLIAGDSKVIMYSINYITFYKKYSITFSFMVSEPDIERYEPLIDLIMAKVVIKNKWN